jgi:succinoglycan biosynthesis protein ExoA
MFGSSAEWLPRIDAHSAYPEDFGDRLLEEARRTGSGQRCGQNDGGGRGAPAAAIAAAELPPGNGGSASESRAWLVTLRPDEDFCRVPAVEYSDKTSADNEDAELDHRLRTSGFRTG